MPDIDSPTWQRRIEDAAAGDVNEQANIIDYQSTSSGIERDLRWTTESPSCDDWPSSAPGPVPDGHFVLMKIDPVASVADLEDEETTRSAAALTGHEWILGIIIEVSYWHVVMEMLRGLAGRCW